jgi:hypothetical protein
MMATQLLHQNKKPHESLYQQLDKKSAEIRLIDIEPSDDFESAIRCQLQKASLTNNPEYIALSYVWGDPKITREITVNDETFHVTANLDLALRQIRSNWEHIARESSFTNRQNSGYGPLWIDAICP